MVLLAILYLTQVTKMPLLPVPPLPASSVGKEQISLLDPMFGIVVDNFVSDQTAALQAAINYASTNSLKLIGHKKLKIRTTAAVFIPYGTVIDFNNTIIRPDASSVGYTAIVITGKYFGDLGFWSIDNLRLWGPSVHSVGSGFNFIYNNSSNVDGLEIRGGWVGSGSIASGSYTINTTSNQMLYANIGDAISITGAGASGGVLYATITGISATTVTINTPALTTVSNTGISSGVNQSQLLLNKPCIMGFRHNLLLTGGNNYCNSIFFPYIVAGWRSGIKIALQGNSGENINIFGGTISNCINATDSGAGKYVGQVSINSGSNTYSTPINQLAYLSAGDSITIAGAGSGGANLVTTVASITSATTTLTSSANTTVTNANAFGGSDQYQSVALLHSIENGNLNIDTHLFGVSVDYNDRGFLIQGGEVFCYGSHLEDNSLNPVVEMQYYGGYSFAGFFMNGGQLILGGGGGGYANSDSGHGSGRTSYVLANACGGHYRLNLNDVTWGARQSSYLEYVSDGIIGERKLSNINTGGMATAGYRPSISNVGTVNANPGFNRINSNTGGQVAVPGWRITGFDDFSVQNTTPVFQNYNNTISVTNGSTAITGTGTKFTKMITSAMIAAGVWIISNSSTDRNGLTWAKIASVTDDTHLVLTSNYTGVTGTWTGFYLSQAPTEVNAPVGTYSADTTIAFNSVNSLKNVSASACNDVVSQVIQCNNIRMVYPKGNMGITSYTSGSVSWILETFDAMGILVSTYTLKTLNAVSGSGNGSLVGVDGPIPIAANAVYLRSKVLFSGFIGTSNINGLNLWAVS
jgi:hypothetical protein